MKHNMNRILSIVALLMFTIGVWAQESVNIVVNNANRGEVTYKISNGRCTLTTTPVLGYYLTKDDLTATVSLKGESMQAPQRTLPVVDNLTIYATDDNADPTGVTTYWFEMPGEGCNVTVTARFQISDYGIAINNVPVTGDNRTNVLNDTKKTVKFDGHNRLILEDAELTKIEVGSGNSLPEDGLEIYLIGENTITNTSGVAISSAVSTNAVKLTFSTMDTTPGTLICTSSSGSPAISGFDISYNNKLIDQTAGSNVATIRMPLNLIIDGDDNTTQGTVATINFSTGGNSGMDENTLLTNLQLGNILYTLNDAAGDANADGYDHVNGKIGINGTSTMTDAEVDNLVKDPDAIPGTVYYAEHFNGMTFLVPPGDGTIAIASETENGYEFHLKIGKQDPVVVHQGTSENPHIIPYACLEATYVRLYLVAVTSSAPAMMADRRIGPKSSVAGGLGGIQVQGNSIAAVPAPAADYKMLSAEDFKVSDFVSDECFVYNDPKVTDLSDNLFINNSSAAPRRAGYVLSDRIKYIDFSGTTITGMEVSRGDNSPFHGVPDNTFIYMPAGNTVKEGTKNVVIGSVCGEMELNGATDNDKPFKAAKNFTASTATLKREFTENVVSTIYLPYSVSAEDAAAMGTFNTVTSVTASAAIPSAVSGGLKANVPYVFTPSATTSSLTAKVAAVRTVIPAATYLVGVYEKTPYVSGDWYCFAGQAKDGIKVGDFVKMKDGAYVPPFRAYLNASGSTAPVLTFNLDDTTAINGVSTVVDQQAREGWWTVNGMRLTDQPTKAGMYIKNGRLVVIR